jgi:uncharacterized membrane protein YGL010W
MKTADQWFEEYGQSHQHRTNKLIHWLAVPLIYTSIIGLLWDIPFPLFHDSLFFINWPLLILLGVLIFYIRLSWQLGAGMVLVSALAVVAVAFFDALNFMPTWMASLLLFIALWILQFIGHAIEGKKPAFFQDLQFLLIGPLWLLGFIYRRLKIPY